MRAHKMLTYIDFLRTKILQHDFADESQGFKT